MRIDNNGESIPSGMLKTIICTFTKPPNKSVVHKSMSKVAAAAENKVIPFIIMVGDLGLYFECQTQI